MTEYQILEFQRNNLDGQFLDFENKKRDITKEMKYLLNRMLKFNPDDRIKKEKKNFEFVDENEERKMSEYIEETNNENEQKNKMYVFKEKSKKQIEPEEEKNSKKKINH